MTRPPFALYAYAACSTCRKAKQWLEERGIAFVQVPIVDTPPSAVELARLVRLSGQPIKRWFNTSGQSYRALTARLGKDGIAQLDDRQKIALLAADGKLIKRPVLVTADRVILGFDRAAYDALA